MVNAEAKGLDDIDGLMQERLKSIANAQELRLSCTNILACSKQFPSNKATRLWFT